MGQQMVYLKIEKKILSHKRIITLGDIASLESTDKGLVRKLKEIRVHAFLDTKQRQEQTFSVLYIMQLIHAQNPSLDIVNVGESDFFVEYTPYENPSQFLTVAKTVLLCIVVFFGAAFTIMAFNNDVGVPEVFQKFYYQVMGNYPTGLTELEVCYSVGLAIGILVFYDHFGRKKMTKDPTPLQVQIRKYEQDVDDTMIENDSREGKCKDVV